MEELLRKARKWGHRSKKEEKFVPDQPGYILDLSNKELKTFKEFKKRVFAMNRKFEMTYYANSINDKLCVNQIIESLQDTNQATKPGQTEISLSTRVDTSKFRNIFLGTKPLALRQWR